MGKNLASRTGFIVVVLLIFTYGIFGIPHGGLKQSIQNRINLGLDLKGGTHLVLSDSNEAGRGASRGDYDLGRIGDAAERGS